MLAVDEFIRRFLLHTLPAGFQRIRYYGLLANRGRAATLALCSQFLQANQLLPSVQLPAAPLLPAPLPVGWSHFSLPSLPDRSVGAYFGQANTHRKLIVLE